MNPEPSEADMRRDESAEQWLIDRHGPEWYIGEASTADWREAYIAVDTAGISSGEEGGSIVSDVTKRTTTVRRVEFAIPNPTDWRQLKNALDAAERYWASKIDGAMHDDSFLVRADDDEIVIWREEPGEA